MSSLTRWVLVHKRLVVISWLVLTIAGIAAAGPATDALTPGYSVPGKEGWETNEAIAARYGDTGSDTPPLVPVVTLPEGKTVDAEGVRAELAVIDDRLREALPGARIASFASTGDRTFVSEDGRTVFALAYPPPDPNSQWGEAREAANAATRALEGVTVAGAPVRLTGIDALMEDSGADSQGVERAHREPARRLRSAPRVDLRLRLFPRACAAAHGVRLDHDLLRAALAPG